MSITVFDIVTIAVIGLFAFLGLRKGLIAEVFKILGIVVGIMFALQYMTAVAGIIHSYAGLDDKIEKVLAFILILLLTVVVFIYLAKIAKLIFKVALMGWLDKSGGLLFGALKGALIVSAFLPLLLILPDSIAFVKDTRTKSLAYKYLQGFAPRVYNAVGKLVPGSQDFATKIKEAFPTAQSFGKISGGEIDPDAVNLFQQFMGSDESATLKELQKQLGDKAKVEDIKLEDLGIGTADQEKMQDLLKKYQSGSATDKKSGRRGNRR